MRNSLSNIFILTQKLVREEGVLGASGLIVKKWIRKIRRKNLPNTVEANRDRWTVYDWSLQGEEWTPSSDWKTTFVRTVLEPNIPCGSRVLEIGPGGGRWTEILLQRAKELTVVDVTPTCIALCKERFKNHANITYFTNDGTDLSFMPAASVDRIWSYDVFVHIQSADIEKYMQQFAVILAAGGVAVIHHSKNGEYKPSWRSDMTQEKMRTLCLKYGFEVLQQFDTIEDGRLPIYQLPESANPDIVTIFAKIVES